MTLIFIITTIICLIALTIASYCDIRTREVPDWLSYGLIISGLGIRLIFSVAVFKWAFIINGLLGFALFFVIAVLMFYTGQWGGGDSKVLMGLGAVIGIPLSFFYPFVNLTMQNIMQNFLSLFAVAVIINTLLFGAVYGIVWMLVLAVKKRKKFFAEYRKLRTKKALIIRNILVLLALATIISLFFLAPIEKLLMIIIFVCLTLLYYFWLFSKAVEKAAMYKEVEPEQLTEGDWIVDEVIVDATEKGKKVKKIICGPKDLGIEKSQIDELIALKNKGKIKKVLIKEGIPFVPSFLAGFIVTLVVGNLVLFVM